MIAATKKVCVRALLYAIVTPVRYWGYFSLMTSWRLVAPVLRTTEESIPGASTARNESNLLLKTFNPTLTNNAPPIVCAKT